LRRKLKSRDNKRYDLNVNKHKRKHKPNKSRPSKHKHKLRLKLKHNKLISKLCRNIWNENDNSK
jgi:hypothetical protein